MDVPKEVLRCRTLGHPWDPAPVKRECPVGLEVWVWILRCPSCGKKRTDHLTPGTYELEGRHYTKPRDYDLPEGTNREDCREELIRREVGQAAVKRVAKKRAKQEEESAV
jgi:hypothetical protein